MQRGLTSYGDAGFSLFRRQAFIKGAGDTDACLGFAQTVPLLHALAAAVRSRRGRLRAE